MSNWKQADIGSDDGLALNRLQAINGSNDGPASRCIYVPPGRNELSLTGNLLNAAF